MEYIFKIAIYDDESIFLDKIYSQVQDIAIQNDCKCEIIKLCSWVELTEYCTKSPVDIIITDIDMPDFNVLQKIQFPNIEGFKASKALQEKYPETEILFVSAHEELAYQSFRYRPFSFISKKDFHQIQERYEMIKTFEIGINVLETFLVLMFLTLYFGCKYKGIKADTDLELKI